MYPPIKKKSVKDLYNDAYAMILCVCVCGGGVGGGGFVVVFFLIFFYKSICCECSFELLWQVDAIQTGTHNIHLHKE